MKKLATLAAGALMAATATVSVAPDTAEAHSYDSHYGNPIDYSYIYCMAHRSGSQWNVLHAWPYLLLPGTLVYVCTQEGLFTRFQYFVMRNMDTGSHIRYGGYQDCNVVDCIYHPYNPN